VHRRGRLLNHGGDCGFVGIVDAQERIAGIKGTMERVLLGGIGREQRTEQRLQIRGGTRVGHPAEEQLEADMMFNAEPKALTSELLE
jgi:hypothetical protein